VKLAKVRMIFTLFVLLVSVQSNRGRKVARKRRQLYNKFEKNKLIDATVHPLADQHWGFILVDGFLHALNENDPAESFLKFLKYNAPELLKRILKDLE
jgi:hypothetical protein